MENKISKKLFSDYTKFLRTELNSHGLNLAPKKQQPIDIALAYFNWQKKLIKPTPRKVYISKELRCPNHLKSAFDNLVEYLKIGNDVTGYLSRNINYTSNHDELLYDWGIHHLHFYDFNKTRKRSGELIFVYVTSHTIYLIDIKNHDSFEDIDLLEILDSNWPELTEPFWIKNAVGISSPITNKDRKNLRKARVNVASIVLKNSKVLMSCMMGGGISTSGDNSEAVRQILNIQHIFDDIGEYLETAIKYSDYPETTDEFDLISIPNSQNQYEWAVYHPLSKSWEFINSILYKIEMMNSPPEIFAQYLKEKK